MAGYVYIVTNQQNGTLYIGVTSDLERRIYEHREGLSPGFAWKYGHTSRLVRGALGYRQRDPAREVIEAMVSAMEDRSGRGDEPRLG
jgi:predicted GIY-YIG superfamily endonuclease